MAEFDIIASTVRSGASVDEIEFEVPNAPPAVGYLLGRRNNGPQPVALALHDERGDKATMLADLVHLASRGFLCLSIDSPITRRASADRDPLAAFETEYNIGLTALNMLQDHADVQAGRSALLGRGIGAEVAASIAAHTQRAQVVVAIAGLPNRSAFVDTSAHPLAAGLRLFLSEHGLQQQVDGLRPHRLVHQLEKATGTHWLLQVPDDDDRLSDEDHATMSLSIPRTVRVDHVALTKDLSSAQMRRNRVDFISKLCG